MTLMLLCIYVPVSSIDGLASQSTPETSPLGVGIALAAVVMLPAGMVTVMSAILMLIVVPVACLIWWLFFRTRWGLKLRAVGADKDCAYAAGINTGRVQLEAMVVAGFLYGVAGADLILAYTRTWQDWGTSGRGFIIWGRAGAFTVPAGLREVFAGTAKSE